MNALNARNAFSTQIIVALLLALAMPRLAEAGSNGSQKAVGPEAQQKLAKVQIPFIPNRGQSSKEVKFTARTFAGTVSVTETGGLVYSLPKLEGEKPVQGVALKEEFIGGKVKEVIGESQAVTKVSYFRGNDRSKWQSNLPSYERVSLGEVYEGIEVKLKAYGNNVEKRFYVKPGAEPETIKIKLSGGKKLRISESGELEVETEQGTVRFSKPVAFQEEEGKREPVEVAYVVRGKEYGFKVGEYDRAKEVVIDPILAATFLGGNDDDIILALALDAGGNVYVTGGTYSSDFPGVGPESADSSFLDLFFDDYRTAEAFVAKLNPDLSVILAATFLGGSQGERAEDLVLDSTGNVYVAGATASADFPGIGPGAADSTFNGAENDGFVAKLNSDLSSILAATFLGGSRQQGVDSLALDSKGNVYVAGDTSSSDFPGVGPGSADSTFSGREGFVARLNSDLSTILSATFLGGSRGAFLQALALDSKGNVYVAGSTRSSDFPGVGPDSADKVWEGEGNNATLEGFVAKLNSDLSSILAATFLGGKGSDELIRALALDSTGNVYAAGYTDSADFPGIGPGSADRIIGIYGEGFVAKLNSDLSSILAATFLGGSRGAEPISLTLDSRGNVYVAGVTASPDFPGIGPGSAISTFAWSTGFVAKLNADLSTVLVSTFLKTIQGVKTVASDVALDSTGNVYVGGQISGGFIPGMPGIGPGSADSTIKGDSEGLVAKLDANLSSGLKLINDKVNFVVQSTSLNPTPVPGGPAGVFMVTARLTNTCTENIHEPINAIVKTLTNGNKLLNATEGNGGAGSKQAIDAGTDNILQPNESATVQFRIGLNNRNQFTFLVDIWGPSTEDNRP